MDRISTGQKAEQAAAEYLAGQGFVILERNFRSSLGEIDIVAQDRDCLVFIEVRSRRGTRYGLPQETVNWAKQQQLRKLAKLYIKARGKGDKPCRFDVVGILLNEDGEIKSIELIRDAF